MGSIRSIAGVVAALKAKATTGGVPRVGQLELTDKTLYLQFNAAGQAGIINLVDVNTKREIGITNLDGNKLNAGRDYVIDGVRILLGTTKSASVKNEAWSEAFIAALPPAIQNAEIRIKQGGFVILDMPVRDLYGSEDELFRTLTTLPLIKSNMEFEFEIEYPRGVAVPATDPVNIRFEFRAHQAKL